jgi:uncharacterized membrane protein
MTVPAIAAVFVHELKGAPMLFGFGPLHFFVPFTLLGIAGALYDAKTHNIRVHKGFVLSVYVGGLLIAGGFAFAPGRIMHGVMFRV